MNKKKKHNQSIKTEKAKDQGTCVVAGFIIGMLIGAATGDLTLWTGMGICLGIVIGAVSGMRANQGEE